MLFLSLLTACVALPLVLQRFAERLDRRRHPAPGCFVPVNGRVLHVVEQGCAAPTVILEAGLAASSLTWVLTPPLLASFSHVVAYDRAGLGRSSRARLPLSLSGLLADLDQFPRALRLTEPYILVGHSFGALIVQAFAHLHPKRVAGLVLLDPVSLPTYAQPGEFERRRLRLAIRLSNRGAWLARFAVVRAALHLVVRGNRRLPSLVGRITSGKGNATLHRLTREVAKLPPETHGPIRAYWSRSASFRLMAEYLKLLPQAAAQASTMSPPSHIPLVILSAATATPAELLERDQAVQNRPHSRHTQIPATTHWLQLDRPDLVAAAVRELIEAISPGASSNHREQ